MEEYEITAQFLKDVEEALDAETEGAKIDFLPISCNYKALNDGFTVTYPMYSDVVIIKVFFPYGDHLSIRVYESGYSVPLTKAEEKLLDDVSLSLMYMGYGIKEN